MSSMPGLSVSLIHAAKFEGQVLSEEPGWARYKGECAAGVQYVFAKAGTPLGPTASWRPGLQVQGNAIPAGTAIASFQNGRYSNDHAAIYVAESKLGIEVWDQYNNPPKPWGRRTLRFGSGANDRSNNGSLFYVINPVG